MIKNYPAADGKSVVTNLIGSYLDSPGSNQAEAINKELFDKLIDTLRLTPWRAE